MALCLKRCKLFYPAFRTTRGYSEEKSIYQRDEEGRKERTVHGKSYPEWRRPWIQRDGEWYSKLSIFTERNPSPNILNAMQNLPNLTVQSVKDWWAEMKVVQEIQNQKFLPERTSTLGSNLAAVHFFTYRSAAVRLKNASSWIKGDATTLDLPDHFVEGYFVEAIDCTDFHHNGIRYEGLQNLSGLNFLKWLSLNGNKHVDVWCLDRIAGQNGKTLQYLDIRGCQLCLGGIFALARMPALRYLTITDPGDDIELQAAISMLESERPHLVIKAMPEEKVENDTK